MSNCVHFLNAIFHRLLPIDCSTIIGEVFREHLKLELVLQTLHHCKLRIKSCSANVSNFTVIIIVLYDRRVLTTSGGHMAIGNLCHEVLTYKSSKFFLKRYFDLEIINWLRTFKNV